MDLFRDVRMRIIKWSEMLVDKLYIYVDDIKNIVLKQIEIQDVVGDEGDVYDDVNEDEGITDNEDDNITDNENDNITDNDVVLHE